MTRAARDNPSPLFVVPLVLLAVPFFVAGQTPTSQNAAAQRESNVTRATVRRVLTVGQYVGLSGASISPDGRHLTFTDWTTGDLAVLDLVAGGSRRITRNDQLHSEGFAELFMRLSVDGKRLVYTWYRDPTGYELRAINADGSGSRRVTRGEEGHVYAYDWSADGRYIAAVLVAASATGTDQLALIEVANGAVQALKDLNGSRPRTMNFSPDGRFLAYDLPANREVPSRDIFVLDIDARHEMPGVAHPANDQLLGWTPDGGALLFASDRGGTTGAWLQSLENGKPSGAAQDVRNGLGEGVQPLGFTRDGAFYYAASTADRREVYTASLDLQRSVVTESPAPAPQVLGSNEGPEWSPDGTSLAYVHDGSTIVSRSLETGRERSLTPKTIDRIFTVGWGDRYLRWSPDGLQLLAPQRQSLLIINVRTGEATQLGTEERSRYGRWSRDGRSVFYAHIAQVTRLTQIVRLDLDTRQETVLYTSPPPPDLPSGHDNFHSLELSPDNQWLAFAGSDKISGVDGVLWVLSAQGTPPRLLLRVPASEWVKVVGWTPDSREILFTRDLKLATEPSTILWRIRLEGGEPRPLELGMNVLNDIRFHPDGKRVAFDSGIRGADIWVMENFLK